ncbi:hypothetical protein SASPL_145108 [Salvia splendens]|uniref:Protein SCO1/2 n=1 Tax=Salvia splendens TaxID=180675 RepID=A0A8X8WH35_SALSN|nr:hypothetical protein SASPL_145108 [Salvia splendens]
MPLLSRGVFAAISHAESSLEAFKRKSKAQTVPRAGAKDAENILLNSEVASARSGLSKIFFSSMSRRPSLNNLSSHPLTEQIMVADHEGLFRLNCFTKYVFSISALFHEPGLALTGIGGLLFLFHHNDQRRVVLKGKGVKFERSANHGPIIGGPFSLINTEDRRVTEKNLLGNWVLLYFGYTSSPDVGPSELRKMANTINILESKQNIKVLPIFVTIDPQRDTPSHLRAYIHEFDSRIVGLTGPVTAIRQMAQEYRVFFRKVDEQGSDYLIESSHNIYLLNPGMEVSRSFGLEYNAGELSEAIAKEIKKSAITEARS